MLLVVVAEPEPGDAVRLVAADPAVEAKPAFRWQRGRQLPGPCQIAHQQMHIPGICHRGNMLQLRPCFRGSTLHRFHEYHQLRAQQDDTPGVFPQGGQIHAHVAPGGLVVLQRQFSGIRVHAVHFSRT